jgi:glycosyltransferase involved in cell wall biosynthesis
MKKISIIVVAYNEANNLKRLKQSIDNQTVPGGWRMETVLVDNGSRDDTAHIAVRLGFDNVVQDGSPTVAGCRNRGGQEASGDILSYVDADCELRGDWVGAVIRNLEHETAAVAGWPVEPPVPMTWVQQAWHAHWINKRGHIHHVIDGERAMTLITTANMSMNAQVLQDVGGFNEELRSGEDMNFMLRAYRKGVRLCACPDLHVIHHGEPRNLKQFYRQQRWHCSRNSFMHIIRENHALQGANAMWFTLAYGLFLSLMAVSILGGLLLSPWAWQGVLPFLCILFVPAFIIALRAGKASLTWSLPVLYAVYGWVRMLDGVGLGHKRRKSWR